MLLPINLPQSHGTERASSEAKEPLPFFARDGGIVSGHLADNFLQTTAITAKRGRGPGRPFAKGQSGNPKGRPRGSVNRGTRAAAILLDGEGEALARKAIEMALSGDAAALRLCLDRIVAPRREQPVSVDLPPIGGPADIARTMEGLIVAATRGQITAGDAFALSQTIATYLRAVEVSDFERRLKEVEDLQAAQSEKRY
jgi:hypothetical protein